MSLFLFAFFPVNSIQFRHALRSSLYSTSTGIRHIFLLCIGMTFELFIDRIKLIVKEKFFFCFFLFCFFSSYSLFLCMSSFAVAIPALKFFYTIFVCLWFQELLLLFPHLIFCIYLFIVLILLLLLYIFI